MASVTSPRKSIAMGDLGNMINANLEQKSISKKSKFRYLTSRSENVEKQIAELIQHLSGYAKRTAKLRDSGDTVAQTLSALSVAEVLNPSLKKSSLDLARALESIQSHRDSEVLYMEDKLLPSLSKLGESLQKQREEIRSSSSRLLQNREGGSSWIKPSNSTRRRSQSVQRSERPSKEEKALQQSVQRYELQRNLVIKKFMLKLILSQLRSTIGSLNDLTQAYRTICREFNPSEDLKVFNEFFNFRSLNKSAMTEVEEGVSGVESAEDEVDSEEEFSDESGLEENDDSDERSDRNSELSLDEDTRRTINSEDDSENSKGDSVSIQSTLRRFNSTPEIATNIGEAKGKINQIDLVKGDLGKAIRNKLNTKKSAESAKEKGEAEKSKVSKRQNVRIDREDESDEEDQPMQLDSNQTKPSKRTERAW